MKARRKPIITGNIELVPINNGLSICLSPETCVISADYDGSNPNLENAKTQITVLSGRKSVPVTVSVVEVSDEQIKYTLAQGDTPNEWLLTITAIPTTISDGFVKLLVLSDTSTNIPVTFTFAVVRDTSTLDWIKDWEGNKTEIGGEYIVSPKIFSGIKNSAGLLTGVYLGRSITKVSGKVGAGVYGYKNSQTVFRIDESGAKIGGWDIDADKIASVGGNLVLSHSEGLSSVDVITGLNTKFWHLKPDGSAVFAKGNIAMNPDGSAVFGNGNITLNADGSAKFKGQIETSFGKIGSWYLNEALYTGTCVTSGFTQKTGDITLSETGIRGYKWRLESNGEGALAGGNISWDATGNVKITAKTLQFSTGVYVEDAIASAQGAANNAQITADDASKKADKAQDAADAANSNASKVGSDLSAFMTVTNGKFEANDRKFASNLEESKYYADQAVQAMPISGKNLFRDTKEGGHWYPNNWGGSDFSEEKITEAVTVGGHALNGYVRFLRNGTQGNGDIKTIADYSPKITKADTRNRYITVSFYARAAQRTAIYLNLCSGNNGEIAAEGEINKEAIISTEWEHKSVTFKTKDEPQYDGLWVWWSWYDAGIPLDMALFQVEFGNRASEWSPSADDVMDYTDQQIGKIPYSGRNLLQMWSIVPGYLSPVNGSVIPGGSAEDWDQLYDYIPVKPNEQLTLSLQGNIENKPDNVLGRFWIYNSDKVAIKQEIPEGIGWVTPQSATFTMPSDAAFVRCSLIRGNWKGLWKLERGTKVTDWTPAPEDTAALIEQNASEIKQLPDSITFSVSKKITGGALNYVSGTQGNHETTTWRDENNTEDFGGKFKIHKECGGKYLSAAFKVRFEGCEFGENPRVTMQVNDQNGWGWYGLVANEGRNGSGFALSDRGETFPLDGGLTIPYNGEYVIYSYDLSKPDIQGDGVVFVRFDYVRGGKITVSEIRVWETTDEERNAVNKEPLPWYPSRWDTGLLDSRITQTANDITLEVENRKSEDATLSTRIQQTADQISLKVNEVIGGENLIDGASFLTPNGFDGWTHQGDLLNHGIKNWTEVGSTCLKITFEKNGCGIFKPIGEKGIAIVKEGLTLTYSMDIRRVSEAEFDDSSKMQIGLDEANIKTFDLRDIPTNEWKRISITTTAGAIRMKNFGLYYYTYKPAPVTVYIKCIKVELGNRATAYMDSDVDSLLATGIDIQKNAITLTADKTTIRNSRGAQIAMFTDKGGKPLIKAEHIDVDNLYVKHLDGATGNFSGTLNAATGSFSGRLEAATGSFKGRVEADSGYFSGELKAATGTFRGKLESAELIAPVGNIGGFHIQGNNLVSTANSMYNAAITFNHGKTYYQFGNRFYTQDVNSDYGVQAPSYGTRTLSFYINQTIRYQGKAYGYDYDYDNVCIANACEIKYSPLRTSGKYGMQYFALGAGHCVLDGVIEGVCCQKIHFAENNKTEIIDPQAFGNRVTIETAYDSNTVALPSLGKFKLFCGRGTLTDYFEASMMSMYIINNTDKTVYLIGRNIIIVNGEQVFAGFDFPSLFKNGRRLVNPKDCAIAPHTIMHVMLLDTGDANDRGYFAYIVN